MSVSWVTQIGGVELAVGALSGWVIALSVDAPERVRAAGVRAPHRLRQAHIDLIVMGVILLVAGLAAPGLPAVWQALLVAGAWVNPLLFLPLAWSPDQQKRLPYRAVTLASFTAMSSGTVALAVHLIAAG
jgi:hydroxylaminobenzene mutase